MFRKVLVANRGEIAVRIIRALRELGILSVAIYSTADEDALHVQLADEAVCVGPAASKDSYLNINNILTATIATGCEAIHPGFGFLSENEQFVRMCEKLNIKFIGPSSDVIELLGNKANAKKTMREAGVPVIPDSDGLIKDYNHAEELAKIIKYPVMIKASLGGGGKGIRLVKNEKELKNAYESAKAEAKASFNNGDLYMEKYIENPKHIEVQILSDEYGNVIHLGERNCSMQRNNQKILEEAPAAFIGDELRKKICDAAVKAAKTANYVNAGTIEFLVDKNEDYYFMEMNTRIQVEHPVTEMVTGVDIVKEQIKIAWGDKLSVTQDDINISSYAIECRICAESPEHNFRPCPGVIGGLYIPGGPGVRVDSAAYQGYTIPPYYDSMIAKIIVSAKTREEAIIKMKAALAELIVLGVDTNTDYLLSILKEKTFLSGDYDVNFLSGFRKE